ncbi:hypothetical protein LOZ64_002019 [Ophidiomyces ophidiicola]|nr:hypothetical protein LOZ64_002019 [Ophidiomyces ophidiicola]KAI2007172.1 hypothetical protein LOZ49_004734 [Ophidiomyces ophidiicola]KAI2019070.1 hypothetical protein LOZ46_003444 [Ophidiomyces ophidiicola]KAI2139486.1 hypothetical protein LOZ29_002400 [Ophidiomyces ophidiicola]KAI2140847.1 hypothetical protein LOZ28_002740 [Ophidiomyces ophidiicola]
MNQTITLGIRAAQALLGIIVLGLTAYVASNFWSLSTSNFMLFNGVWTAFIVVPYMVLAPMFFPVAAHIFAIIAVDAVTMIFWFAGFIALGADLPGPKFCRSSPCHCLQAATVFGAFEWMLFTATLVFAALPVIRNRGGPKPNEGIQPAV